MAPITTEVVDDLKATIAKLEARVQDLESKLQHKSGSGDGRAAHTAQQLRMILIGPPGAGMS